MVVFPGLSRPLEVAGKQNHLVGRERQPSWGGSQRCRAMGELSALQLRQRSPTWPLPALDR